MSFLFLILSFSKGLENYLSQSQSWTVDYICTFEYQLYPFDTQTCHMEWGNYGKNIILRPIKILYTGSIDLQRYYFRDMKHCQVDKNGRRGLFIDFIISRPLMSSSLTMFLPTAMLLLISQMSTTFSNTYLEMVIDVNATLLLVLTT